MRSHPSAELLSLFASADVPRIERWKVRRHLARCEQCQRQLSMVRAATVELKHQARAETLTGFEATVDWSRLEREMEGNIVVGVAAARCVDNSHSGHGALLKAVLVVSIAGLFVLGWWAHVPSEESARIYAAVRGCFSSARPHESSWPILRTQPGGIVVGSQEGSLTILHPASAVVSVSGTSSVEARYIDEETGQVTINDVYGQ